MGDWTSLLSLWERFSCSTEGLRRSTANYIKVLVLRMNNELKENRHVHIMLICIYLYISLYSCVVIAVYKYVREIYVCVCVKMENCNYACCAAFIHCVFVFILYKFPFHHFYMIHPSISTHFFSSIFSIHHPFMHMASLSFSLYPNLQSYSCVECL